MRSYILTDWDKQVMNAYIETGEKQKGYRVLKHLAHKNIKNLDHEIKLLYLFLNKATKETLMQDAKWTPIKIKEKKRER